MVRNLQRVNHRDWQEDIIKLNVIALWKFTCQQRSKRGADRSISTDQQRSKIVMTSSNGNIFRVTGPLCGEFTGPGEFPAQRPVTRSFDVFFDLHPNKPLSKQPWGWWFETPSWSLWRHYKVLRLSHVNTLVVEFSECISRGSFGTHDDDVIWSQYHDI